MFDLQNNGKLDLQQNTGRGPLGQIFKLFVEIARYASQKGKGSLMLTARRPQPEHLNVLKDGLLNDGLGLEILLIHQFRLKAFESDDTGQPAPKQKLFCHSIIPTFVDL